MSLPVTDRELLELAVKAARRSGMKLECPDDPDGIFISRDEIRNGFTWSPLTDDGDALRLAVMLGIKAGWHKVLNQAIAWRPLGKEIKVNGEDCGGDAYAATRRAIVLAAAEIGRVMP